MKVHQFTQGEDLAAIRARLELDDEAILHIGAAGAIHFDDAAEQDAYDDRVLDEAKGVWNKRNQKEVERRRAHARELSARKKGVKLGPTNRKNPNAGRPKGSLNKKTLALKAEKGGSN